MLYLYILFGGAMTYSAIYEPWSCTVFFALLAAMCLALWWHKEAGR